ncbi:MAG: hypothetical protein ACKVQU_04320 [Burkholderiales bacterium]
MRGFDDGQARKAGIVRIVRIAAFVALIAAGPQGVLAQDFPSRTVRLIVGAAAGSWGVVLARVIGDERAKTWKQSVVIDNRPGAGGIIANQALSLYRLVASRQTATQFHLINRTGALPFREDPAAFHQIVSSFCDGIA